ACLDERRLCRREARQRNAVRRARHVVETELVAESDALRLAAVLPADAHLQIRLRRPTALDRDAHQVTHAALIERLERIPFQHALLEIEGEELSLGVVAREPERRLRKVVRAEGEEIG